MARKTREQLGISASEYKEYQKVRKARNALNKRLAKDYARTLNIGYKEHIFARTNREKRTGKRLNIGDFKSKQNFDLFLEGGLRYTDYDAYRKSRARDYMYNMRQALVNMGANQDQLQRYDELVNQVEYIDLDAIYASSEELDLSYIYYGTQEQGIERVDMTLDILETSIDNYIEENYR